LALVNNLLMFLSLVAMIAFALFLMYGKAR
jgi:hypothetical protein